MCLTFVQSPEEMKTCQRECSNCPKGNHGLTEEDGPAVTHSKDGSKARRTMGFRSLRRNPTQVETIPGRLPEGPAVSVNTCPLS